MAEQPHFENVLQCMGDLRVDRSTGNPAPHKPLLLLVVFDLAERGELGDTIELKPQLAFRFSYFSVVAYRRGTRPDIRLPFHHLVGDGGIWTPLLADGSVSDNRRATVRARLSDDLLALARDPAGRDAARRLLIAKYFRSGERAPLYALVGMPVPPDEQIEQDARLGDYDLAEEVGRNARFRIEVVAAYDYACALTGHRLLTIDAGSIVDAAHIHPFVDSKNNDVRNGLALTKNMHWAFDEGLWSVDDDYRVIVARDEFAESCPDGRTLNAYARPIAPVAGRSRPVAGAIPLHLASPASLLRMRSRRGDMSNCQSPTGRDAEANCNTVSSPPDQCRKCGEK